MFVRVITCVSIIYFPLLAAGVTAIRHEFHVAPRICELADEEPALGVYEANTPWWGGSVRHSPLPASGLGKGWRGGWVGEETLIRGENYS